MGGGRRPSSPEAYDDLYGPGWRAKVLGTLEQEIEERGLKPGRGSPRQHDGPGRWWQAWAVYLVLAIVLGLLIFVGAFNVNAILKAIGGRP